MNENYVIAPSSEVRLLKVPIQIDEKNQLDFANYTGQYSYFSNLPYIEYDNFTYIRQDSIIRIPACIDDIIEYNYVMYKNEAYSNKWFYAFITKMDYVSSELTAVTIKEDSFQTWMFNIEYKNSFIEREHATDDRVGANLIDEGLATGEYMINSTLGSSSTQYVGLITTTIDVIQTMTGESISTHTFYDNAQFLGGVPSGNFLVAFPLSRVGTVNGDRFALNPILEYLANEGKSDAVSNVYVIPYECLDYQYGQSPWSRLYWNPSTGKWQKTAYSGSGEAKNFAYCTNFKVNTEQIELTIPTTIDGYTPRNNKLLTGRYNYLLVDNNAGAQAKYDFELFYTSSAMFEIKTVPTPGCSMRLFPKYYNYTGSVGTENISGLNGGKLPIGSWDCDVYTNWLTQNGVNILGLKLNATEKSLVNNAVESAVGIGALAFGNPLGLLQIGSGLVGVLETMNEDYRHSLVPPQCEGNQNCGDVTFATGHAKFTFYQMCIRNQFARQIDDFFDMFGYKTNRLKSILIHTRSNWNYIKTIDCNIEGNMPQNSLQTIKDMFNRGFTIWHNPTYFLDYSQTNSILETYLPV